MEKVVQDDRSIKEIEGYWNKFKGSEDRFNQLMKAEIYHPIRTLILALFPPVVDKKTKQISFNQSVPAKLSDMKKYVFEAKVFDLPNKPWKNSMKSIVQTLADEFKLSKLEKNQSPGLRRLNCWTNLGLRCNRRSP